MPTTMLVVMAVFMAVIAALFLYLFSLVRRGGLPRNHMVGLRTRQTMMSERTWRQVHDRYAYVFLVSGLLLVVMAAVFAGGALGLVGEVAVVGALLAATGALLAVTVAGGLRAHSFARRLNEGEAGEAVPSSH